ncbi:MAG: Mut7-C RNAse domain-containing protein [Chloroflexota bacterium]|nr:Mut7-C RNAse domain-containing protein [Chloroflexota bacterium]
MVDINVGRLAKWLRAMGYDTIFPKENGDNELVRIALRENRVLVTRDAGIALRRVVRLGQMSVALIEKDDLRSQLKQLVQDLELDLSGGFSLCVCCNEPLHSIDKQDVVDLLPPYALLTPPKLFECPECRRVYWPGTHWANMKSELSQVSQEAL